MHADFCAAVLKPLGNVVKVLILPYHNLAGSKYDALNMKNTMPLVLPDSEEIANIGKRFFQG